MCSPDGCVQSDGGMRGSAVNLQAALMVSSTPFSPTEEADWNASERTLLQGNPKSGVGSKNETLRKNLVPGINCILLAVFCHSDHHIQCYACGVDSHCSVHCQHILFLLV